MHTDIHVEVNQLNHPLAAVINRHPCLRSHGHLIDRSFHTVSEGHKKSAAATLCQELNIVSLVPEGNPEY